MIKQQRMHGNDGDCRVFIAIVLFFSGIFFPVPSMAAAPFEKVSLQLKWMHQFQFAGYYAAIEKGYYRDVGLDVTLKEAHPGMDVTEEVVSGRAEYGIEMPGLLLKRQKGYPVVVLAAIFQHSPEALIVLKDSGVTGIHDLIGKPVMLSHYGAVESRAMLYDEGIQIENLNIIEHSWDIGDLISGKVVAMEGYLTDRPFILQTLSIPFFSIRPQAYGVDFYGDCLFTSEEEIEEHSERVEAFLAASLKGWRYAMAHPEEIVDLILAEYSSRLSREALFFEAETMKELLLPKLVDIGHMNPGRWQHIAETFVKLGMLDSGYSLDGFLYDPNRGLSNRKIMGLVWILSAIVFVAAAVVVIQFVFNRKLNKQVAKRTEHLMLEVTERKKAEKQLQESEKFLTSIVDNIPNMIFVKNAAELRYASINRDAEDLFGFTKDRFVGKTDYEIFSKEEADFFTAKDREVLNNKVLIEIPEETLRDRNNGIRTVHTIKIPILDEQGNSEFLLGITEDITEKKQVADEKAVLTAKLRQAQKMEAIGTLAGGIAHDFNNILTAIYGYAELAAMDSSDPEKTRKYIAEVLHGAERAKELVKQILTFSRKSDKDPKPIRLQAVVEEAFKLLRSTLPTTIEIHQNIDPDCLPIIADPTEIHQVIMNLCTNAYHAMRDSGGVLGIEVKSVELGAGSSRSIAHLKPGSYLQVAISDTGEGMDENVVSRIFEPYFTTKHQGEGTGLGLAVTHGIISSLGGDIVVHSKLGSGTVFTLYLPIAAAVLVKKTETSEVGSLPTGDERILLVDDDRAIVEMQQQKLFHLGYEVTACYDSVECLRTFEQRPQYFDVLITDMTMPGMAGDTLATEVLKLRPDMPIILCTGFSDRMDEQKAKAIGIGEYVMKPVLMADIAVAIKKVLTTGVNQVKS